MMGQRKSYNNLLEVEFIPKEKKHHPYKDKGESNDYLYITSKGT
jgi:hypothetical protein